MDEKIDTAISNLVAMVRANIKADEALKFTQAALNLAHAKQLLSVRGKSKTNET
jgi:hypothetical protein